MILESKVHDRRTQGYTPAEASAYAMAAHRMVGAVVHGKLAQVRCGCGSVLTSPSEDESFATWDQHVMKAIEAFTANLVGATWLDDLLAPYSSNVQTAIKDPLLDLLNQVEPAAPDTMTVTVRDHVAEDASWGSGPTWVVIRKVTISAHCVQCGARRGEPRWSRGCEDGEYYQVQVWDNPCGHTDMYRAVVREAAELAQAVQA